LPRSPRRCGKKKPALNQKGGSRGSIQENRRDDSFSQGNMPRKKKKKHQKARFGQGGKGGPQRQKKKRRKTKEYVLLKEPGNFRKGRGTKTARRKRQH